MERREQMGIVKCMGNNKCSKAPRGPKMEVRYQASINRLDCENTVSTKNSNVSIDPLDNFSKLLSIWVVGQNHQS